MEPPAPGRPSFLRQLQTVSLMGSLRDSEFGPMPTITIKCWNGQSFDTHEWSTAYPFYTLADLKLNIYLQRRQNPAWLPSRVFVGIGDNNDTYNGTDFLWFRPEKVPDAEVCSEAASIGEIVLMSPLKVCEPTGRVDINFVDPIGSKKQVSLSDRRRCTLEDIYLLPSGGEMPTFYAFCFDDMLRRMALPNGPPISARNWNGRFAMYFPELSESNYQVSDEEIFAVQSVLAYRQSVRNTLRAIEDNLDQPIVKPTISGILALQLTWPEPTSLDYKFEGVETMFFRVLVNGRRPFMRFLPSAGTPVTKIHTQGVVPIPDIADPGLILQWAKEVSPTPNDDFLFIKVLTRPVVAGGITPVYGTVRMFNNGGADAIILPSKQQGLLKPDTDLRDIDIILNEGVDDMPNIHDKGLSLGEVSIVLGLTLDRRAPELTLTNLRQRLSLFSYFFQEVPAFDPTNRPRILLKYKAISQFATEPRIFSFISQWITRHKGQIGEALISDLTTEFGLSEADAHNFAERYLSERDTFTILVPEINKFTSTNAAGIDIAIFGPHPNYRIEIYKCNSEITLQRIYTLLSMMLTLDLPVEAQASPEVASSEAGATASEANAYPSPLPEEEEEEEEANASEANASDANAYPSPLPEEEEEEEAIASEANASDANASDANASDANASEKATPLRRRPVAAYTSLLPEEEEEEEEEEEASAAPAPSGRFQSLFVDEEEAPAEEDEYPSPLPEEEEEAYPSPLPEEEEGVANASASEPPPAAAPAKKPALASLYFNNNENENTNQEGGGPGDENDEGGAGRDWPAQAKGWFIKQLNKIDPRLFAFKTKLDDDNTYTRKCQASSGQQPMGLTQQEYDQMREEYESDKNLMFILYPLTGTEVEPPANYEVITVMKYGSDPANLNYYFCPELFCLKDRIMVRRVDFEGKKWRIEGKEGPKPPNRCPFCGGMEIKDQREYKPGHTVFRRMDKPKSTKPQTFIGFAEPTSHPEGLQLPCCYLGPKTEGKSAKFKFKGYVAWASDKGYKIGDKYFVAQRKAGERAERRGQEPGTEDQEEEDDTSYDTIASYELQLNRIVSQYILDAGHHPLDMAKFGMMGGSLDTYFNQVSSKLIRTLGPKREIAEGSQVFLRMGVQRAGFFGALAPYLKRNSMEEVKQIFIDALRIPERFLNVNFGNLVNEFYEPTSTEFKPETDNALSEFASLIKTDPLTETNRPDLERLYISYYNFMNYLDDNKRAKEYRIFAPILAYPGIITERGLVLILLEYDQNNLDAPLKVKCPPFGYHSNIYGAADFAFMLRDKNGTYEAIIYAERFGATSAARSRHGTMVTFQTGAPNVPEVAAARRDEFSNMCKAPNATVYTGQQNVAASTMLSYSQIINPVFGTVKPHGIVRDAYNHIVGAVFADKAPNGNVYNIPFPIIDNDGYIPQNSFVYFDWSSLYASHVNRIVNFYYTKFGEVLARYPGYVPNRILRDTNKQIRALGLANGILIPARGKADSESLTIKVGTTSFELPVIESEDVDFEPEWLINRQLVFLKEQPDEVKELYDTIISTKREKLEELYQHFRMSVANWLNSSEVSGDFKRQIENIIFPYHEQPLPPYDRRKPSQPSYEKRKRLIILLDAELRSWFVAEDGFLPTKPSLFRRDCRAIDDPGLCNDACIWKAAEGTCALHIPTRTNLDKKTVVSTTDLFIRRVIDELIEFPMKRQELLRNKVRAIGTLKKAIHIDDQWIIPENTPTWLELLSLKWTVQPTEKPKHYEERTRAPAAEAEAEAEVEALEPEEEDVIPPVQLIGRRRRSRPAQAAAAQPEAPAGRPRPRPPPAAANDVSSE